MSGTTARDARARSIATIILPQLNDDELLVLEHIGLRILRVGRESHGELVIASETRDMIDEACDEWSDAAFYLTVDAIRRARRRRERIDAFIDDEPTAVFDAPLSRESDGIGAAITPHESSSSNCASDSQAPECHAGADLLRRDGEASNLLVDERQHSEGAPTAGGRSGVLLASTECSCLECEWKQEWRP